MSIIAFATIVTDLLPALNADSFAELEYWTEAELYELADDAARILGHSGVLVERSEFDVSATEANYALASFTLSTIHISLDGRSLRPINVQELEARNSNWRTATDDNPTHFATDISGFQILTLYPAPNLAGTGAILRHYYTSGSDVITVRAPEICGDFVRYQILAGARAQDGDGQMLDVANHAKERASLYRAVFEKYWEPAE